MQDDPTHSRTDPEQKTKTPPHPSPPKLSILAHVSRYRFFFRVSVLTYHNPANNPINGITEQKFPRMLLAGPVVITATVKVNVEDSFAVATKKTLGEDSLCSNCNKFIARIVFVGTAKILCCVCLSCRCNTSPET